MLAHQDINNRDKIDSCISTIENTITNPTLKSKQTTLLKLRQLAQKEVHYYISNAELNTIWKEIQKKHFDAARNLTNNLDNPSELIPKTITLENIKDLKQLSLHLSKLDRDQLQRFFNLSSNQSKLWRDELAYKINQFNKHLIHIVPQNTSDEYLNVRNELNSFKAAASTMAADELLNKLHECRMIQQKLSDDPSQFITQELYHRLETSILNEIYQIPGITRVQVNSVLASKSDPEPLQLMMIAPNAISAYEKRREEFKAEATIKIKQREELIKSNPTIMEAPIVKQPKIPPMPEQKSKSEPAVDKMKAPEIKPSPKKSVMSSKLLQSVLGKGERKIPAPEIEETKPIENKFEAVKEDKPKEEPSEENNIKPKR